MLLGRCVVRHSQILTCISLSGWSNMAVALHSPVQRLPTRSRCTPRCTASASPAPSRRDALVAGGAVLVSPLLSANPAFAATSAFDFQVTQYDKPLAMSTFANQVLVVVNVASE